MMSQISLLAKTSSASFANARLEPSMHSLMPMDAEYPVKGFVTISAFELTRRDFLNIADCGHFGHLGDQRVVVVKVLDSVDSFQV